MNHPPYSIQAGDRLLDLSAPDPADLGTIETIAHALSQINRFTGHLREPYSVAEHSVRVARAVADLDGPPRAVLAALLHDAHEAYLGDISGPLKSLMTLAGFSIRNLEERLQELIEDDFCVVRVPHIERKIIGEVDHCLLIFEAKSLFERPHPVWEQMLAEAYGHYDDEILLASFRQAPRRPWTHYQAREAFLTAYYDLRLKTDQAARNNRPTDQSKPTEQQPGQDAQAPGASA